MICRYRHQDLCRRFKLIRSNPGVYQGSDLIGRLAPQTVFSRPSTVVVACSASVRARVRCFRFQFLACGLCRLLLDAAGQHSG